MKKISRRSFLAVCGTLAAATALTACGGSSSSTASSAAAGSSEAASVEVQDVALKVWGPQEDQVDSSSWLPTMCEQFNDAHPEWNITFTYEVCPEGDASKNVTQDVSTAADVYMFANDQLGTLVQANAIAQLGGSYLDEVLNDNPDTMIESVTSTDGGVYGVPFTGNTWFMYYDTSVFSEDDVKSLDTMLEKGKVAFPLTDSWYIAAFYYANGCTIFGAAVCVVESCDVSVDADGSGLSGLREGTVNAIFSGTWNAEAVKEALGDNFGATQLPTITIDGEAKQMRSFAGSKAIGVNPNCQNMQAAVALAVYLGSAEAQKAHYEMRGIVPTSNALSNDATVSADIVAMAQANTIANTSVLQATLPEMGSYWTPSENMGKAIVSGEVTLDNAAEKTEAYNNALNNASM